MNLELSLESFRNFQRSFQSMKCKGAHWSKLETNKPVSGKCDNKKIIVPWNVAFCRAVWVENKVKLFELEIFQTPAFLLEEATETF